MRFRHIRYIEPRPVTLCLGCTFLEDADCDPSLVMRFTSCVWTYFGPNICRREERGKPRAEPVLRHHANEYPVYSSPQDRFVPELITATGSNSLGGFTLFQVCAITPLNLPVNSPLTSTFTPALGSATSPPARSANSTQSVARGACGPSLCERR